jgi:hypothetical protein
LSKAKVPLTAESRIAIAKRIESLADQRMSINEDPQTYIALEIGVGTYKNAITVSKKVNRVSFFIESADIREAFQKAGFVVVRRRQGPGYNKDRYSIMKLDLTGIEQNIELVRRAVKESIEVLSARKPSKAKAK